MPLAVETRMLMPVWAKNRGYPEAQITQLQKVIRALCTSRLYRLSVSEDTSVRYDLDGYIVGLVSDQDRATAHAAAQAVFAKRKEQVTSVTGRAVEAPPEVTELRKSLPQLPHRPAPAPLPGAVVNAAKPTITMSVARPVDASRGTAVRTIEAPMRRR